MCFALKSVFRFTQESPPKLSPGPIDVRLRVWVRPPPPSSLVVDGQVKVLDFDLTIARERGEPHAVAGTPAYMAPEIFQGEPASESSDLFNVGVMARRMVAGPRSWSRAYSRRSSNG